MKTQSKFKRALCLLLSLSFILSMTSLPVVHAATAPVALTVSDKTCNAGENVVVSVSIPASSYIAGADMFLQYDSSKLEVVNDENNEPMASAGSATGGAGSVVCNPNYDTTSTIYTMFLSYFNTKNIMAAGSLIDVTFKVKTGWSGSTPLTLTVDTIADQKNVPLEYTITSGSVTVTPPDITTKITFDTDGGTTIDPVSGKVGSPVPTITPPTKSGYVFDTWSPSLPTTFQDKDITVKALWKSPPVTLTVLDASGKTDDIVTVKVNLSANSNLGNCDLYLTYDNRKLAYQDLSGTSSFIASYEYGVSTVGNLDTIHLTFAVNKVITTAGSILMVDLKVKDGWSGTTPLTLTTDNFQINEFESITPAIINGTFTNTTPASSTITFDSKGGSSVAESTGTVGTTVQKPTDPTYDGYRFDGWYSDSALNTPVTWPYTREASNVTFYAKWVATSTLIIDPDNGTAPTIITQDEGSIITPPATPSKDGYRFMGWEPAIPSTMPVDNITCKAKWAKLVTITFDSKGGSEVGPIEDIEGASIAKPTDPTKTDYTFNGWYLDEGYNQVVTWPYTLPSSNVTFYAKWTINRSSITFDSKGGSAVTSKEGNIGDSIAEPTAPTLADNIFAGWYSDTELSKLVTWPYTLTAANVTFYAKWTPTSTITFDSAGGSGVTSITLPEGTTITKPADPTKDGYRFLGWDPAIPPTMQADNMTCVAKWGLLCTITFNSNGGSEVKSIEDVANTSIAEPTAPTKDGFTFDAWYMDDNFNQKVEWNYTLTDKNVTFYAKWTQNVTESTVTYESNGGSDVSPFKGAVGTSISAPDAPTKDGFTFEGWYMDEGLTQPVVWNYVLTAENVIFYANWTQNVAESTVTYESNGGSDVSPFTGAVGSCISAPDAPTKDGFTFEGWYMDEGLTQPVEWDYVLTAENVTFYANWTEVPTTAQYTVIHYKENLNKTAYDIVANTEKLTGTIGSTVTATDKNYPGFTAVTPLASGTVKADGSLVLIQNYSRNTYTVTWDASGGTFEGGSPTAVTTVAFGNLATPPTATKAHYTFTSWSPEPTNTPITMNRTFKANWTPETITITWDAGEGQFSDGKNTRTTTVKYDVVPTPPIVTRANYISDGWTPAVDSVMNNGVTTYTAKWKPVKVAINWYANGGIFSENNSDVLTTQEDYDSTPTGPVPTLEGSVFDGWDPVVSKVSATTIYTAKWKAITYTITFKAAGGVFSDNTDIATKIVSYNETPIAPAPTRVGFTFVGWDNTIVAAKSDFIYTAVWEAKAYVTITFITDGGSDVASISGYAGDPLTAPTAPTKTDFMFLGWSPDIPKVFPAENMTLTALWQSTVKPTAAITYDGNDIGDTYLAKVSFLSLYQSVTMQLGYVTDVKNVTKVEFISDNPNVIVDETGKITNKGFFSRSANITLNVYDQGGNIAAKDTVKITFYKFDTSKLPSQVQSIIEVLKMAFLAIVDWFGKLNK